MHPVNVQSASSLMASIPSAASSSSPAPMTSDSDLRLEFDRRRPVRSVIASGYSATIPMRTLNSELTCPVCLGIIRECTSVMECLHRFCAACIEKSLRFGKKECPSCRVACPSRRNLRKDAAFDAVIHAIYPDISKAEASQDAYTQDVIKSYNVRKFGEIASKGAKQQRDQARRSAKRPASPPPSFAPTTAQAPLTKRARNPNKPEPISFSIVQHPSLSHSSTYGPMFHLPTKFVRTSRYLTVLLLKKWLQLKLITDRERVRKAAIGGAASSSGAGVNEEKKEGDSEMKDAGESKSDANGAASSNGAAAAAASSPSSSSSSSLPPIPSVRFVLYVRAFDTSLLAGTSAQPEPPGGEETFIPLASDLTLDYIEEHMWATKAQKTLTDTMKLNHELQTLPAGEDPTPLLREQFRESFTKCATHRKAKTPCPEDCVERVAAATEFLARETEKVTKWREACEAVRRQASDAALATAKQAQANGVTIDPQQAAAAAIAATPTPPGPLTMPQVKKRRLVLYYSLVGASGEILLDTPSIAPHILQKYVIAPREDADDDVAMHLHIPTQATAVAPQAVAQAVAQAVVPMQIDNDTSVPALPTAAQ